MASTSTLNRLYWATVKDVAANGYASVALREVYPAALAGDPDREILPQLERLEATYGPRRTSQDLRDPNLWPARKIVDALRR